MRLYLLLLCLLILQVENLQIDETFAFKYWSKNRFYSPCPKLDPSLPYLGLRPQRSNKQSLYLSHREKKNQECVREVAIVEMLADVWGGGGMKQKHH